MKKMKKVLSILLASVMTLAMAAPGFAAPTAGDSEVTTGSITISNVTKGKEYKAYKLFDANPSGNGNNKDTALIAYTADLNKVKAMVEATKGEGQFNPDSETLTDDYFLFTKINGSAPVKYNVEVVSNKNDTEVITYLKNTYFEEVSANDPTDTNKKKTVLNDNYKDLFEDAGEFKAVQGKETELVLNDLSFGYYFVTSSLGTSLTITSTNYDVKILDKNQGPHWDDKEEGDGGKKITKINDNVLTTVNSNDPEGEPIPAPTDVVSANYEDKITYEVKFQATDYDGEKKVKEYYLKDVLAPGMSYVKNGNNVALEIKVEGKEKNGYTLQSTDYTITTTTTDEKNKFELRIPWINENGTFKYPYTDSVQTVTITYSAEVDTDAEIAGDGNKNTVSLKYWTEDQDPNEDDPHIIEEEKETITYVYAFAIKKTNTVGDSLSGATFTLTNKDNSNVQLRETVANSGIYEYVSANSNEAPTPIVSPESGKIIVKGVNAETYTLKEIKAPAGYNLLTNTISITPVLATKYAKKYKITYTTDTNGVTTATTTSLGDDATESEYNFDSDVPVLLEGVINNAGTILPATGGIGTTIFYAAGIILMAGAVFFVIRRRRA